MVAYARTAAESEALAEQLTNVDRDEPIIVIATYALPAAIDPVALADRTGAAVHVLQGYESMSGFSDALPAGTASYVRQGESCIRVYPAGLDWMDLPQLSRFEIIKPTTNYRGVALPRIIRVVEETRDDFSGDYDHDYEPAVGHSIAAALSGDVRSHLLKLTAGETDSEAREQALVAPSPKTRATPSATPSPAEPEATAAALQNEIEAQRIETDALKKMVKGLRVELQASKAERKDAKKALEACRCDDITEAGSPAEAIRQVERRATEAERERDRAETKARRLTERRNSAKESRPVAKWLEALHVPEEEAVRMLLRRYWEKNYPLTDQEAYPLGHYEIQPAFLATVSRMHDADLKKIVHVMTDIASTRADTRDRTIHPYRQAEGPEEPDVVDAELGTLMRINLENNTPAAKRLHFWKGPGGKIVFHSALQHDDKVTWPEQKSK